VVEIRNPIIQRTHFRYCLRLRLWNIVERRKMLFPFFSFVFFSKFNFYYWKGQAFTTVRFQFFFHRIKNLSYSTKFSFCLLYFLKIHYFSLLFNLIIISYSYLKRAVWIVRSRFRIFTAFVGCLQSKNPSTPTIRYTVFLS
jgi:hypothetical protein